MFSQPVNYSQPESMAIPACLVGEEQKTFRNCRSVIKSIPSSSGSGVGPSSTMLFQIPTGGLDFLKPNSLYLRCKVSVTLTGGAGVTWKFAGQGSDNAYDYGGASSLISRINVNFGGVTQSYSNYNHYRNAVLIHALNTSYFATDLKQLEYAGVTKVASTNTQAAKDVYVSIPLFVGAFNSQTALPLCLMSSPIQLEIQTETVNNAFSGATTGITGYSITEASIVYEAIQVEPSFIQALKTSKQGQSFNFRVNDYLSVGPFSPASSERFQVGAGLQSLKSVLFTEQLQSCNATALAEKNYVNNGLSSINFYIDGQQVSMVNQDNDAVCFAEMNRSLQRINDANTTSFMEPITPNVVDTGLRTAYTSQNFLAGCSTMNISDWGYSMVGTPASVVQVELNHSALADQAVRWGNATAYSSAVNAYLWLLYDANYSVDLATGVVSIRK